MMIAGYSYLAATLVYAIVLVLALFLWRGRLQGGWLLLALGMMVLWSGYLGLYGDGELLGIPGEQATPDPNRFFSKSCEMPVGSCCCGSCTRAIRAFVHDSFGPVGGCGDSSCC
ncbi:hypothetical protein [Marinobacterium aestuariivivens]|uniref:Uncharacterized protein n=1 Tax=Marinobacterium aestuariivivens TaxID=1698799 RepID=A0ABW1ZTW2_9GAMM